jgi:integrase
VRRRRRANGTGAVYLRRDGRWAGDVDLGWDGNRRVRKVVYGDSRKEVEDRLRAVLNGLDEGRQPPPRAPHLENFLQQWLTAIRPSIRPSTYASYEGMVRLHIAPAIGRIPLDKLAVDHIASLIRQKEADERLSSRSVRYVLLVLRNALNKAVRWGIVTRNVATLVDGPRVAHKDVRVLSPEETTRLLSAAHNDQYECLVVLAVSTGIRLGEALAVKWTDIDLDRRQVRIDKSLQRVSGRGLVLTETKTRRSRRTIVLPVISAEALRKRRGQQRAQQRAFGRGWRDDGYVFTSSTGAPVDARNVQRSFRRILRRARLPRMRFHDLRHSCASLLLTQGVAPRVVMETLGHSRISVTMDTYTHVMPALQREAADAIDRALDFHQ